MDLVYPLGINSAWAHNELRYSLRSIEKYASNVGRVIVIGHKPKFISSKVAYIHLDDPTVFPQKNQFRKVMHLQSMGVLDKDFLYMNDDFILVDDIDLDTIPVYKNRRSLEDIYTKHDKTRYGYAVRQTEELLIRLGLSTTNYDIHAPFRCSPRALEILNKFDKPQNTYIRSVLGNYLYKGEGIYQRDIKLSEISSYREIEELRKHKWISFADSFLHGGVGKEWLQEEFPMKSKYEI